MTEMVIFTLSNIYTPEPYMPYCMFYITGTTGHLSYIWYHWVQHQLQCIGQVLSLAVSYQGKKLYIISRHPKFTPLSNYQACTSNLSLNMM